MGECKRKQLETKVFGEHTFFQEVLDKYEGKKIEEQLSEKVVNHGAVQKYLESEHFDFNLTFRTI